MTLVVACATKDIGFMVADTLLSSEFELKDRVGPVNGKYHALKVHILDPSTAIAFAGDVEPSFDLIKNLYAELREYPSMNVPERLFQTYLQVIEKASNEQAPDCEFLVLQLTLEGRKLTHVTREGMLQCERAYIGDPEEYKRMKELQRPYLPPKAQHVQQPDGKFHIVPLVASKGEIEFAEISNALETLCHQRRSKSVGAICGSVTRVVDARISGKLEYLQSVEASLSLEEGHSGFSFLASNTGIRGVGIYFRSGKMGYLLVVGDSEPCRREDAKTFAQFVTMAKEKYGLNLTGGSWTD